MNSLQFVVSAVADSIIQYNNRAPLFPNVCHTYICGRFGPFANQINAGRLLCFRLPSTPQTAPPTCNLQFCGMHDDVHGRLLLDSCWSNSKYWSVSLRLPQHQAARLICKTTAPDHPQPTCTASPGVSLSKLIQLPVATAR